MTTATARTVRVVCRPVLAPGFRLAGLKTIEADDAEDAARRLDALLGDSSSGIVLIEQDLHDALPAAARRALAHRPLPLVVPFPGADWAAGPADAEAFIAELLRQAIGYRVRLR